MRGGGAGGTAGGGTEETWVSRRLHVHRQLSSSDSWGSEDFESYSSNEEENGGGPVKPQAPK